jgi:hypothetical protein
MAIVMVGERKTVAGQVAPFREPPLMPGHAPMSDPIASSLRSSQ